MKVRSTSRFGVLLLAGTAALVGGLLATPVATGGAERSAEAGPARPPAGFARLTALERVRREARESRPGPLARQVERLAEAAVRRERSRPFFPVRAPFNWGQSGARFGAGRGGRAHAGQDVLARTGAPLVAIADGVVVETGNDGGRGNYVALYDPRERRTYVYLHMDRPSRARRGERVRGGELLGGVGCTGSCFGDHLHFEVRRGRGPDGAPIDPLPLLRRWAASDRVPATLAAGQH